MSTDTAKGYDSAQARREDDDLDRWRFAAEIVEVVSATPPDWSARIGIFGKWGEGKTTVLRFSEQMLKASGNVVFNFNPWALQTWDGLWQEFGDCLSEALSAAEIRFDSSWKEKAKKSEKWLDSTGVGQLAEGAAALFGREKLYNFAFGALTRWLKYDGAQIRTIREKLKEKRIVVLIDDLDRCAPNLVPQLLLSLRELLDLPAFTFILAFDDEIVARSIVQENPAWDLGADFLEKILDFRFHLPPITKSQKQRLVDRALAKYCDFVPSESVVEVEDTLPDNPRKLKSLIRSLAALRPQVARHDPDELNWVDMWLAQMLRLESYPFFERLLAENTLEAVLGESYRISKSLQDRLSQEAKDREDPLDKLINEAGVRDSASIDRIRRLSEAVRSRGSFRFRYVCELAVRPHAVTWKEFRALLAEWKADKRVEILKEWITQQATNRNVPAEDVRSELFESILVRRNECLSAAAESSSVEEHASQTRGAGELTELCEQFLLGLAELNESRFRKIYGQSTYWIGFRKNPSDEQLREQERTLLPKLAKSASGPLCLELFEIVSPTAWEIDPSEESLVKLKRALRESCLSVIAPKAAEQAVGFLSRQRSVRSLSERGRFISIKRCLFQPDSIVWKTELRSRLFEWIEKGCVDLATYENVRDLLSLLAQGLERGVDIVSREDISKILVDNEFVQRVWEVATSRPIQYRMRSLFLRARSLLIKNGSPEHLLRLTDELASRLAEEKAQKRQGEPLPDSQSTQNEQDLP